MPYGMVNIFGIRREHFFRMQKYVVVEKGDAEMVALSKVRQKFFRRPVRNFPFCTTHRGGVVDEQRNLTPQR